jgi:mannose-1-phosphate guanylyltransferase/mannose-6-phosphate isomerase
LRRDPAAAVAVLAYHVARKHPETIVLILSADHVIGDATSFVAACRAAALMGQEGFIMTLDFN